MQAAKDAGDLLREAGIRVTGPRVVIFDYLIKHRTHPTCDQIFSDLRDANPSLSLASVYNVTEKLAENNLIVRLVSPDGERHYDSVTDFHAHFYCDRCGKIFDVAVDPQSCFEELEGALIDSVSVSATGLCPECNSEEHG